MSGFKEKTGSSRWCWRRSQCSGTNGRSSRRTGNNGFIGTTRKYRYGTHGARSGTPRNFWTPTSQRVRSSAADQQQRLVEWHTNRYCDATPYNWTSNDTIDIFIKIINRSPINQGTHWLVLSNPAQWSEVYDSVFDDIPYLEEQVIASMASELQMQSQTNGILKPITI